MKGAALLPNLPDYNLPPMNRNSGTTKTQRGQGAWLGGLIIDRKTLTYSWGRVCSCSSGSTWPAAYPSWPPTLKGPGFVTNLDFPDILSFPGQEERTNQVSIAAATDSSLCLPLSLPRASARPLALLSRMAFLSLSIFNLTMATLLGWIPTLVVAPLAFSLWMRSM